MGEFKVRDKNDNEMYEVKWTYNLKLQNKKRKMIAFKGKELLTVFRRIRFKGIFLSACSDFEYDC